MNKFIFSALLICFTISYAKGQTTSKPWYEKTLLSIKFESETAPSDIKLIIIPNCEGWAYRISIPLQNEDQHIITKESDVYDIYNYFLEIQKKYNEWRKTAESNHIKNYAKTMDIKSPYFITTSVSTSNRSKVYNSERTTFTCRFVVENSRCKLILSSWIFDDRWKEYDYINWTISSDYELSSIVDVFNPIKNEQIANAYRSKAKNEYINMEQRKKQLDSMFK